MNHIELFAGCGGLALGLEQAGFKLLMANELSPMAAETFVYNFFNEDLELLANQNKPPLNTIWLSSKYEELKKRLRENPYECPTWESGFSDMPKKGQDLCGKMIVGSIINLNNFLQRNIKFSREIKDKFEKYGGLDVVTGGPPCQSFSMAGKRIKNDHKNSLPWEFIKFVDITQPKIALLENVTGILRPFKDTLGSSYYAWYEVAKGFASIGYVPLCIHLNARKAGVAQNRPRFIMISVRADVLDKLESRINKVDYDLFKSSRLFFSIVAEKGTDIGYGHLELVDATKLDVINKLKGTFLENLVDKKEVSVEEAIGDLRFHLSNEKRLESEFVKMLNKKFTVLKNNSGMHNHEPRRNNLIVRCRFRLYQILREIDDKKLAKEIFKLLAGKENQLLNDSWEKLRKYDFMHKSGKLGPFNAKEELERFLLELPTKKQTQKALVKDAPAPAALTIPDDACHYDKHELRVLTVREMARIQSFPDNFIFRSKITTGGKMRKFETPQYTQVGNAVPPMLGYELGCSIKTLLSSLSE